MKTAHYQSNRSESSRVEPSEVEWYKIELFAQLTRLKCPDICSGEGRGSHLEAYDMIRSAGKCKLFKERLFVGVVK